MTRETFTTKLHLASDLSSERQDFHHIHFKCGFAYASDTRIAIKQSLEYHPIINPGKLDGKMIHAKAFAELLKFQVITVFDDYILAESQEEKLRNNKSKFEIMVPIKNISGFNIAESLDKFIEEYKELKLSSIAIDPDRLVNLKRALYIGNSKGTELHFKSIEDMILVTVPNYYNQWGIIMPVRIEKFY